MGHIRIGVSGWNYRDWRGDFYPESLPASHQLSFIAEHFDTVEINGTFYALSTPRSFRRWYASVLSDFVFAVKGSRFITHNKKLADVDSALANFFASGVLELDDKLGPILWQAPKSLRFDAERVDRFLERLPRDTSAARVLARNHDERVETAAYGPDVNHRIRHVLEVRHESFWCDEMISIARRRGVALAFSHSREWPYVEEITAGFVYVRLHGPDQLYSSPYGENELSRWADRVETWSRAGEPDDAARVTDRRPPGRKGRDVYVYFDNDAGGHAPREAAFLRDLVGRDP